MLGKFRLPFTNRLCGRHAALALCAAAALAMPAAASQLDIAVNAIPSMDIENNPANSRQSISLAANAHITGVSYDVNLTANSGSWLSELTVSLLQSSGIAGLRLVPGYGDNFSGSAHYSSGGLIDLAALGLDFTLGADGVLALQYFDDINDVAGADGHWNTGSVSVFYSAAAVPEPSTWAVLALGLAALSLWRRRAGAKA